MAYVFRLALELNRRTLNTRKLICNGYKTTPSSFQLTIFAKTVGIMGQKKTDLWHYDKNSLQWCEDERDLNKSYPKIGLAEYANCVIAVE